MFAVTVPVTFFDGWVGALAYTLQLYFDFSGYSDMALGLSRLFGVTLPANFQSPYKSVNIIDAKPRLPAQVRTVDVTGGRHLRDVTLKFEDLHHHADRYGDDYLRVFVELERPVISLYDQVREVLPNALEVKPLLPQLDVPRESPDGPKTMSPQELFAQYFAEEHDGNPIPEPMLKLFGELYEAEAQRAPA